MSCRELLDLLDDYVSGELPAARRRGFEAHLAACLTCDRYATTYLGSILIAKAALAWAGASDRPPEELVRAICALRRGEA